MSAVVYADDPGMYDLQYNEIECVGSEANPAQQILWKTSMTAFSEFVPGGKFITPALEVIGSSLGINGEGKSQGPSTAELSRQMEAMRNELNQRIDKLEEQHSHDMERLLDEMKSTLYTDGFGKELDDMHRQITGWQGLDGKAQQISNINNNPDYSDNDKAVMLASLIGNYTEWTDKEGNFVYRFKSIGSVLSADEGQFRDAQGRDLYKVLYDSQKYNVMFSGEAYDIIDPYVDRVMYEFLYDYTVLAQCLDAALTVSQFTPEDVAALKPIPADTYRKMLKPEGPKTVQSQIDAIAIKMFKADDSKSVISHYAVFKYKKDHDRAVFVNKGAADIRLATDIRVDTLDSYGPYVEFQLRKDEYKYYAYDEVEEVDSYEDMWGFIHKKEDYVRGFAEAGDRLHGNEIRAIYDYAHEKNMTFLQLLESVGIDVSNAKVENRYFSADENNDIYTNSSEWFDCFVYLEREDIGIIALDPLKNTVGDKDNPTRIYHIYSIPHGNLTTKRHMCVMQYGWIRYSILSLMHAQNADIPDTAEKIVDITGAKNGINSIKVTAKQLGSSYGYILSVDDLFSAETFNIAGEKINSSDYTWEIPEDLQYVRLDPQYHTLSISVRGNVNITVRAVSHTRTGDVCSDWVTVTINVKAHPAEALPPNNTVPQPAAPQNEPAAPQTQPPIPQTADITISGSASEENVGAAWGGNGTGLAPSPTPAPVSPVITYPVSPTLTNSTTGNTAPAAVNEDNGDNGDNGEVEIKEETAEKPAKTSKKPVVKGSATDDGFIRLKWGKVNGATKYRIYRINGRKKKLVGETEKLSARLSAKEAGEYSYAVSAFVNGKWTTLSPDDVVTVTVD